MGNFLDSPLKDHTGGTSTIKTWQFILVLTCSLYLGKKILNLVILKVKQSRNSKIAKALRHDRDSKKFSFEPVDQKTSALIIESDCHRLRELLHEGTLTSVQLVNFYSQRSYKIGRALNLTA